MIYKFALILWIVTTLAVSACVSTKCKKTGTLTECLTRIKFDLITIGFFFFVLSMLICFLLTCILVARQWRSRRIRAQTMIEDARNFNSDFFSDLNGMGRHDVYLVNEEEDFNQLERGVADRENHGGPKQDMADKQEMATKKKDPVHRRRPYVLISKEKVKELVELAAIVKIVYPESVLLTINDYDIVNISQSYAIENMRIYGPSNDRTIRKLRKLGKAIRKAGLDEDIDDIEDAGTSQDHHDVDIDQIEKEKQEKLKKIVLDSGFKNDHFQLDTKYKTYLAWKQPLRHSILRNKYYIL